jgi:carboxyl-terminal processing protease
VDGVEIEAAVKARAPRCLSAPDPAADAYAINVAVAGIRGKGRTMRIERAGVAAREVALPLAQGADKPDLEWRRLANGMGCITIRSFADPDMVAAFDAALLALRDAPALLIDMRANGGGNTAVARPIMGRFITERKAYARMRRREGAGLSEAWTEYVDPRGPFTYHGPVAVLVSHWSASMAEGFPMGMRDIGRGLVVGTPMMGLGAAVLPIRLDRTGITAQYSGEPVYDTQDRPRSDLKPDVAVADGGDILAAAVAALVQHGRVRPSSR